METPDLERYPATGFPFEETGRFTIASVDFSYDCGHSRRRHYHDADGEWWCQGDPDEPEERCRCHGCSAVFSKDAGGST